MTDSPVIREGAPVPDAPDAAAAGPDRAQLGLAALVAAVGIFCIAGTWNVQAGFSGADPLGPRFLPRVVGLALIVLAVLLAVATLRGDRGEAEEGEDVDLSHKPDWMTVAQLAGIFALNIALVDFLGWAITGALLFAGVARVLGSRTWIRDLIIGAVLSVGSFYAFYVGLGVPIPPGILDGIL
ncbi:tripartite tricarboxylate transporter TctB family protein [Nostocoides veronense]|uniref:Tripartite tricarboxylate transporter TctB family protein n=1 Tax=Nostocoides veronense TaxID=330836 RepID=A0ABP4Y3Q9_9MICO